MAAVPLLTEKPDYSDDDEQQSHCHCNQHETLRPALVRRDNIAMMGFLACMLGLGLGLSVGITVIVVMGLQSMGFHGVPSTNDCLRQSSSASPLLPDLDISYHVQQFNGSFMQENIYRQDASPEVDAAWEALGINCTSH